MEWKTHFMLTDMTICQVIGHLSSHEKCFMVHRDTDLQHLLSAPVRLGHCQLVKTQLARSHQTLT